MIGSVLGLPAGGAEIPELHEPAGNNAMPEISDAPSVLLVFDGLLRLGNNCSMTLLSSVPSSAFVSPPFFVGVPQQLGDEHLDQHFRW